MKTESGILVGLAVGAGLLTAGSVLAVALTRGITIRHWRIPTVTFADQPPPAPAAHPPWPTAAPPPDQYDDLLENARRQGASPDELLQNYLARGPRPDPTTYIPGDGEGAPSWATPNS